MNEPFRVYADTSVFGGVFDDEFNEASRAFFEQVRFGKFQLVTSDLVRQELCSAPPHIQELFQEILIHAEISDITDSMIRLQQAYINAAIVTQKSFTDALHVAIASVSGCDGIISWNFKHIVHFQKIPLYNAVNTLNGYHNIFIHSPLEVINNED